MKVLLDKISNREDLSADEAERAFCAMVQGELDAAQIAALLIGLRTKGEHTTEVIGAARALRNSCAPFERPHYDTADSCGTGGDGAHTINVSTATAVVAAEMGVRMVKHGNRSVSSQCGSADVLEALGVRIDAANDTSRRCLDEAGICFLYAPQNHPGLRFAGPVRQALGVRTVMNLLGPLVNPARPSVQIMGVYDPALLEPVAKVLGALGCRSAMVVHGSGLDEVAVHGPTQAVWYRDGALQRLTFSPTDAGLKRFCLTEIRGGGARENAVVLRRIFEGQGTDAQNAVVAMNAGALAMVAGLAADIREGTDLAMDALTGGGCAARLEHFARLSHAV
ncbi:MAG: anthranilate phosphoribosyltransferase [Myxococcales bacterium]|jgi:anthranilate phosphoribosyltransferase|nr:anthranilate phosphoribosyltransferase [Myxococcales bacterium]